MAKRVTDKYVPVAKTSDIPPGKVEVFLVDGEAVGVANVYSWSLLGVIAVAVATGLGRSDRGPR